MEDIITNQESAPELEERTIETVTAEILYLKAKTGEGILEIGKRLIEAKEMLPHGEWLPWLKDKVDFTERSAQRFIRLAKEYSNTTTLSYLTASKALALLELEPVERDEFLAEKHDVNGEEKSVSEMSARELEEAIKARKKAEDKLEELKTELEDIKESHEAELEERQAEYDALVKRSQKEVNELTEEIERVKKTQREVVEVVDNTEIDALNARLDKKAEELAKLRDKLKQTEASLNNAKQAAESQKKALENAVEQGNKERLRAEKLEKQLASAGNNNLAEFKLHFGQAQNSINKMLDILKKAVSDGDDQTAATAKKSMRALFDLSEEAIKSVEAIQSQLPGQMTIEG